eukprot:4379327-Pyramimonas_sp.AAC.1
MSKELVVVVAGVGNRAPPEILVQNVVAEAQVQEAVAERGSLAHEPGCQQLAQRGSEYGGAAASP